MELSGGEFLSYAEIMAWASLSGIQIYWHEVQALRRMDYTRRQWFDDASRKKR